MASDNSTDQPPAPRVDRERLHRALAKTRATLLAERGPHGHWEGELSSSALSTATAVTALELWQRAVPATSSRRPRGNESKAAAGSTPARDAERSAVSGQQSAIELGLKWLAEHQNADGGWGDTTLSFSNISTTALCWAAFGAVPGAEAKWPEAVRRAEAWLAKKCQVISNQSLVPKPFDLPDPTNHSPLITNYSPLSRPALISAIIARYGKDRTFSVPILTMCALAGRLGEGKDAWRCVIQLPFELAALPHKFFAALRLPVVSYALPALIAIGQVRHHHLPTRNPITRLLRNRARAKTLRVLERIQPPGGGFLEATPLTSFVTMSLTGSGNADHPVARRGVEFLLKSMRADGSWPIDTNLATWVTTLAVNALGPSIHEVMSAEERERILDWLLGQQYRTVHPYTNAAPGGWAWTDLPGGVPDADDTAGALLALKHLSVAAVCDRRPPTADGSESQMAASEQTAVTDRRYKEKEVRAAAIAGVKWLLDLQNRDGGIPTFCRGWTNLPFDRSSPDITAHALRAWTQWKKSASTQDARVIQNATLRSTCFLVSAQNADGSWSPLWFGNQTAPGEENRTYGTAQVVKAVATDFERWKSVLIDVIPEELLAQMRLIDQGVKWLFQSQNPDCGWGSGAGTPSSVEETALAIEALASIGGSREVSRIRLCEPAVRGLDWLLRRVEDGTWTQPAPIGFYFAKLWYYERLYPMVFTVAALEAVARLEATEPPVGRDSVEPHSER